MGEKLFFLKIAVLLMKCAVSGGIVPDNRIISLQTELIRWQPCGGVFDAVRRLIVCSFSFVSIWGSFSTFPL